MDIHLRLATDRDIEKLRMLIEASVRGLQAADYSPEQLEGALAAVYGVDSQLNADETYFVAECEGEIAACGGWSKRKTLCGGDQYAGREDSLLNPMTEAAKIRAFFVHPKWSRRGIGSVILEACESAAKTQGFHRLEMAATLSGVEFYKVKGYAELERMTVPLAQGEPLPVVRMGKSF